MNVNVNSNFYLVINYSPFAETNKINDMVINNGNYISISHNYSTCLNINGSTQHINISNLNIEGSFDLKNYKYLTMLICNGNKITKITNLSENIELLDCSYNNIEEFNFSFGSRLLNKKKILK